MMTNQWNPTVLDRIYPGSEVAQMTAAIEALGSPVPEPLARAGQLLTIARGVVAETPSTVLDLKDGQVRADLVTRSIRRHKVADSFQHGRSAGLDSGLATFESQLVQEARAATLPLLDGIITGQRAAFDRAAVVLMAASQRFGFTMRTSSDLVVDMDDADALPAWRATRPAWRKLNGYHDGIRSLLAAFRIEPANARRYTTAARDLSVYFAAGDNWGDEGNYYLDQRTDAGMDWFAIAAAGLRLNAPGEIEAKRLARGGD